MLDLSDVSIGSDVGRPIKKKKSDGTSWSARDPNEKRAGGTDREKRVRATSLF